MELPDPEPLSSDLIDVLASLCMVLLGWYAVLERIAKAGEVPVIVVRQEEDVEMAER